MNSDSNLNSYMTKDMNIKAALDFLLPEDVKDETEYWLVLLFALLRALDYETQKMWNAFAEEVKTKNRFFPESELLSKIDDIADKATRVMPAGEIIFRAREYAFEDFLRNEKLNDLVHIMNEEFRGFEVEIEDLINESPLKFIEMYSNSVEEKHAEFIEKISKILNSGIGFYGYDKTNSDAPLGKYAKEGRANPKGISYLYTAKDIKTAVLEMRPQMKKKYSIATVKITKDVRLFDFTYSYGDLVEDGTADGIDLRRISEEFSKPNFGDTEDYTPTQFLCEYIKKKGYDGIVFNSAVSEGGINVLLFDTDEVSRAYDIVGSQIYEVNALDIDVSRILPVVDDM